MRKIYHIYSDNLKKTERTVARFLLENADIVRFTNVRWFHIGFSGFGRKGNEKDERFIKTIKSLENYLIRKVVNNKRYNNIPQGRKRYEHYLYRLSNKLREMIKKEGIIWNSYSSKRFYGFEDPAFYKNKQMIGCMISHEPIVILYLTSSERKKLEEEGVFFDAPCCCKGN